jgi:hypothetical protein
MKKDAYYFSHFANARHDRKIKRLRKDLGIEGYGVYFMLLEVLREQVDFKYPLADLDLLAEEFGISEAKLRAVLTHYDLFQVTADEFFSMKFIYYLTPYIEKTNRARLAANIRWGALTDANACANALPEHCNGNANQNARKGKERIGEESKGEESKGKESDFSFIVNDVMMFFDFNEQANFDKLRIITQAMHLLDYQSLIDHFKTQFEAYKTIKADKRYRHSFHNFIGTIDQHFIDGAWNAENWPQKLALQQTDKPAAHQYSYTDSAAEALKILQKSRQ